MGDKNRARLHTSDYVSPALSYKHLKRARNILLKAQKIYAEGLYFDCLSKLEESMLCVHEEPLSEFLRLAHPKLYSHVLNCYLQAASCYIKLEQYDEASKNCDTILAVETSHKALYLKGVIHEELGKPADALIYYQKAAMLAPNDQSVQRRLQRVTAQTSQSTLDTSANQSDSRFGTLTNN